MSDLDTLLNAKDDFAFLGLEPQFPLTAVALDAAVTRIANQIPSATPEQASQLRQRLSAAKQRLADPVQRARYLLALLSGVYDPGTGELPDSVKELERQVAAANDPAAANALKASMMSERQARLDHLVSVFSFPRDIPNRVSQSSRDSAMWSDLRVIEAIDQLLAKLS